MSKLILPEFDPIDLVLKTKPNSLRYGRRLYYLQFKESAYWLKLQSKQGHPIYQQGFQRELEFYQHCFSSEQLSQITLPFQIIETSLLAAMGLVIETGDTLEQALILPDAQAYFAYSAQSLDIATIQQRLMRVLNLLHVLHEAQWLHADLKQEHFVEYAGQLKLIDFEQIQPIEQPSEIEMHATPRYMAPELFHGEQKTQQSDIYALGIILYEWLSGQRLSAKNYTDWAYLHCQRLEIELPEKFLVFKPFLSKMLAKHKAARFDNICAIKHALVTEIA